MKNLSYRIYYVFKRNLLSYRRFIIPTLLVSLGEPLFYLVTMGIGLGAYMGLFGGKPYLYFLAPGLLITSAMLSSSFECLYGTFVRMVHEKVFDAFIVTPLLVEEIVAGEIFWGIFRGLISGFMMFLVSIFLGIYPASAAGYFILFALMILVGFLFASLSMIVTAFAPNFDFFNYYTELFITPMFFFAGVFFPLDKMPDFFKILTEFFPLTHAVAISRAVYSGIYPISLVYNFVTLLLIGSISFYLALFFMKRRLIK